MHLITCAPDCSTPDYMCTDVLYTGVFSFADIIASPLAINSICAQSSLLALQEIECLRKGDFDKSGKGPSNTRLPQMQAFSTLHSIGVIFVSTIPIRKNSQVRDFDTVQYNLKFSSKCN